MKLIQGEDGDYMNADLIKFIELEDLRGGEYPKRYRLNLFIDSGLGGCGQSFSFKTVEERRAYLTKIVIFLTSDELNILPNTDEIYLSTAPETSDHSNALPSYGNITIKSGPLNPDGGA